MTIDELAAKMDERFQTLGQEIDKRFGSVEQKFESVEQKFESVEQKFESLEQNFESLEQTMDRGFNDSKIRDERLEGLMTFGLEARDVLRDEMHRRFDEAARKHDDQITLLKDAVQHINPRN